jgi:phosphoribosylamine--glycine ligase
MGRDAAAAERFAQFGHEVHTIAEHRNPSLVDICDETGGLYFCVNDMTDVNGVANCVKQVNPQMFYTNYDDALAAGVVDAAREAKPNILIPSPNKEAARIEWDKSYLREIIDDIDPKYNPLYRKATSEEEVEEGIRFFEEQDKAVAVKPFGLSGGKAVKLMGPHLDSYKDAKKYGVDLLSEFHPSGVSLEELMEGHEFTLQGFCDGQKLLPFPATYDYPYREDGDKGPGTGGMGDFTMRPDEQLPFLAQRDYEEAVDVMQSVVNRLHASGNEFKGTIYGSFFMTEEGLEVTEFNARGGDPEMMNIVNLLDDNIDLAEVLSQTARGELNQNSIRFKQLASTALYLVSPDYAREGGGSRYEFDVNPEAIARNGCRHYLVGAERDSSTGKFATVGSSRTLAMLSLGQTPWEAREKIHQAIEDGFDGPLEYRQDIGSKVYINGLST